MSTKKRIKQRDSYRCQICGDNNGKIYDSGVIVEAQAHHILYGEKGGSNKPDNMVTLCDQCHAVIHEQRWGEHFGNEGTPENLEEIKQNYESFLKLPYEKRERIKGEIWKQLGV